MCHGINDNICDQRWRLFNFKILFQHPVRFGKQFRHKSLQCLQSTLHGLSLSLQKGAQVALIGYKYQWGSDDCRIPNADQESKLSFLSILHNACQDRTAQSLSFNLAHILITDTNRRHQGITLTHNAVDVAEQKVTIAKIHNRIHDYISGIPSCLAKCVAFPHKSRRDLLFKCV